jgi:hypothetical protein
MERRSGMGCRGDFPSATSGACECAKLALKPEVTVYHGERSSVTIKPRMAPINALLTIGPIDNSMSNHRQGRLRFS